MTPFVAAATLTAQLFQLPNGMPLIVEHDPDDQLVTLLALAKCDDQPPDRLAALEILCKAVMRETQSFSTTRLRYLSWLVGGRVEVDFTGESIYIEITTAPSHFSLAATLLYEMAQRPSFSEQALTSAFKDAELDWLELSRSPWFIPVRRYRAELGIGPRGPVGLNPAVAQALWQSVVRPNRMALAIVGGGSAETATARLSSSFGLWTPDPAPRFQMPRGHVDREPKPTHAAAIAAIRGPLPEDPGFAAWMVLCSAVAWGAGSKLHRTLRDELGLTYQIGCALTFRQKGSHAIFHVAFSPGLHSKPRMDSLEAILRSLPEKLSQEDVTRARELLRGQYRVAPGGPRLSPFGQGQLTTWNRAYWLAWWQLRGGFDKADSFPEDVGRVGLDEVRGAAESALETLALKAIGE